MYRNGCWASVMHLGACAELDDAQILVNLADRLRELAEDVAHVAVTVSEVTGRVDPPPSPAAIHDLQKIDALHQSLRDLAQLSDAMACQSPARDTALNNLKLAATRALLKADGSGMRVPLGSVDLF